VRTIVDVLFLCLWGGVVFVAVRTLGSRYFRERANAAAVLAAVAFAAGGRSPFALEAPAPAAVATEPPRGAATPRPTPRMQDLAACSPSIRVQPDGHGSVDDVRVAVGMDLVDRGDRPQLAPGDGLHIRGWAANDALTEPASAVCAVVDGKLVTGADVRYGADRGDVAQIFGHPALAPTGYELRVPPGMIPRGEHRLGVAVVSADRSHASVVPGTRTIDVR
jgi:hypothetical protein